MDLNTPVVVLVLDGGQLQGQTAVSDTNGRVFSVLIAA